MDIPKYQVLLLRKALYGTKQASRLYQQLLVKRLLDIGFKQSSHDPCVFRYKGEHGDCIVVSQKSPHRDFVGVLEHHMV